MEYNIYLIDFNGLPHFIQKATDVHHANDCSDRLFDDLYIHGETIVDGTCYNANFIVDIEMVRADKDPYKGVIER